MRGTGLERILLVEDDPDIQIVTSLALSSFGGFTVEVCSSAEEAIRAAPAFCPDLLLMDVLMPDMDGLDALKALRQIAQTATTPVIFLTAKVHPPDMARYKELGSLAVIGKPFDPSSLVETIHGIWDRHYGRAN